MQQHTLPYPSTRTQEEIENEEIDETLDMDLASELLHAELPYAAADADEAKEGNTQLSPVPASVVRELEDYASYRSAAFHRSRQGAAVETTTVGSDSVRRPPLLLLHKSERTPPLPLMRQHPPRPALCGLALGAQATALRFLRYLKEHEGEAVPSVRLFASPQIGAWVQRYLERLRGLGLMASTLAVYTNGIISMAGYALTLVDDAEACPVVELLNLRRQAESIAKQERLFAPKSKHWLSWEAAQEARVKCFSAYHAARGQAKTALLRDSLVMAFHTLQPPDRVGVVRRLRLGVGGSLYKKQGEATYTVDLSRLRHKTSRL